jgi:hypothetical protein
MYIDPGFGALLLQGIVAGILGSAYVARQRLRQLWRRLTGKTDPPAEPQAPPRAAE